LSIQGNIITGACNGLLCKSGEFYFAILGNSFCNTVLFDYAINNSCDSYNIGEIIKGKGEVIFKGILKYWKD